MIGYDRQHDPGRPASHLGAEPYYAIWHLATWLRAHKPIWQLCTLAWKDMPTPNIWFEILLQPKRNFIESIDMLCGLRKPNGSAIINKQNKVEFCDTEAMYSGYRMEAQSHASSTPCIRNPSTAYEKNGKSRQTLRPQEAGRLCYRRKPYPLGIRRLHKQKCYMLYICCVYTYGLYSGLTSDGHHIVNKRTC